MLLLKKDVVDSLVKKVNNICTSGFVLKTKKYQTDKPYLEKKIPGTSGVAKKMQIAMLKLVK